MRAAKWGQQVGAAKILRYQDDEVRDGVDAEGDGRLIAFHLLLEAIIRNTGDPHGLFLLSFR